jgi:hypothetical protein
MRLTRVICDACSAPATDGFSVLGEVSGPIRLRLPESVELCSTCADSFVSWLRGRDPDAVSGPCKPLEPTDDGSTRAIAACSLRGSQATRTAS